MKTTRRFIAGFSAMAMAAAMAMSASAADPTQIVPNDSGNPNPETAGAEVTYNVDAAYTVTIPAGADISSGSDVQSITADDVLLEQGKKITVTLSEASNTASGKLFTAKDESGESTVNYTIKAGDTDVEVGGTVAEFETKTGEQSATLTFTKDADSTPTFAGTHTETLTFNIAVEEAVKVETLLTTITATGKTTYNQSKEGVVTVTPANIEYYDDTYGWLWNGTITVEPMEGYTITKCRFIQNSKTPLDDDLAPFSIVMNDFSCSVITSTGQKGGGDMDGVTSIEVYGYAN